jgi:hypothetical protein
MLRWALASVVGLVAADGARAGLFVDHWMPVHPEVAGVHVEALGADLQGCRQAATWVDPLHTEHVHPRHYLDCMEARGWVRVRAAERRAWLEGARPAPQAAPDDRRPESRGPANVS